MQAQELVSIHVIVLSSNNVSLCHEDSVYRALTSFTDNGTEWYEPKFQALLNNTGCNSLACLRNLPYEDIYQPMNGSISGSWYPVIDGNLFPEHPAKLLASGQYHKIPMIDGVNTDEGTE